MNRTSDEITFIKTGGVLAPDSYSLTLRSAVSGFKDVAGELLDGDDDGTPGGDYFTSFAVVGPLPRVVSLPDVMRGPGQPVNIPTTVAGIPIRLSDGAGVDSLRFTLNYDPALLTISDVTALPVGSMLVANLTIPGQVKVAMSFPIPLASGAVDILTLTAAVPATAPYRAKQVLDLTGVSANEGKVAAVGDDAVHVVAYFGDTTGNGAYSSLDGQRVLRQVVGLDSGFAAYLLADPVVVADITGNRTVSSQDATRILQEVVGFEPIEIPPLAGIAVTVATPGPDPYVHIPTDLSAVPGSVITVPVLIDDALGLEAADLRLVYDPAMLEVLDVRAGSASKGATVVSNSATAGVVTVGLALTVALPAGGGSLLDIDFRIKPTAALGATALNLTQVSLNEDGLVLTPLPIAGQDPTDGLLTIRSATGNTAPMATDDDYTTAEDTLLSIAAPGILANDSDVDGNPLTASLVDGPAHGTLTLSAAGDFTYTPNADYFGSDSFTYRANDGQLDSNLALVTLTITPVNDAPVAIDDAYTLNEDTPLNVLAAGVLSNDSDIDSPTLTAVVVDQPQHGTLILAPDGGFLYTPDTDYFGSDSFSYHASDGQLDSNLALVTLTITPVNDAPVAIDDAYTLNEDTSLNVPAAGVLSNDSDIDSTTLTAVVVDQPQHGALTLAPDGGFLYTPDADYFGADSFSYRANDGQLDSNLALVTLTITPVDDAPVAADDAYTLNEDTPLNVPAPGILGNDTDIDSQTLTAVVVDGPQHGALILAPDGDFLYTPDADYFGSDSFSYRASDGQLDSKLATVSLTIQPVNDAPVAVDDSASTHEDTPIVLNLTANDTDVDNDPLSVSVVGTPQHGSAVLNSDGTVSYTPFANYSGDDAFDYTVIDGAGGQAIGTVRISVTSVNSAPVAVDDAFTLDEDVPLNVAASGVLANDTDIDSPTLTAVVVDQPQHGALILAPDGGFLYTPDADYFGADSFTYRANDGQLDSNLALVTLTIQPVNDAPVASTTTTR
ncbi:MAG: tandem-95 repeat protein [Candidatus Accumulibacter sp.]|uniref:tandem-95 repeat protein n=1 Tax=Accumulibacter sp. TaxID=2053492 RepID=UPI0025E83C3F|nr:Ig-like domain-containing protein [Accumulibacter sp.]MCP5248369.1 tandem-95 repeat protein [Accumulibacter sp.]